VVAAIFWLKTRAGWRETSVHELRDVRPIEQWTDAELDERIELLTRAITEQKLAEQRVADSDQDDRTEPEPGD
jgi:hypothetical protein